MILAIQLTQRIWCSRNAPLYAHIYANGAGFVVLFYVFKRPEAVQDGACLQLHAQKLIEFF